MKTEARLMWRRSIKVFMSMLLALVILVCIFGCPFPVMLLAAGLSTWLYCYYMRQNEENSGGYDCQGSFMVIGERLYLGEIPSPAWCPICGLTCKPNVEKFTQGNDVRYKVTIPRHERQRTMPGVRWYWGSTQIAAMIILGIGVIMYFSDTYISVAGSSRPSFGARLNGEKAFSVKDPTEYKIELVETTWWGLREKRYKLEYIRVAKSDGYKGWYAEGYSGD